MRPSVLYVIVERALVPPAVPAVTSVDKETAPAPLTLPTDPLKATEAILVPLLSKVSPDVFKSVPIFPPLKVLVVVNDALRVEAALSVKPVKVEIPDTPKVLLIVVAPLSVVAPATDKVFSEVNPVTLRLEDMVTEPVKVDGPETKSHPGTVMFPFAAKIPV
jgi:hypothetical protein